MHIYMQTHRVVSKITNIFGNKHTLSEHYVTFCTDIYVWQQARHGAAGDDNFIVPLNALWFQCFSNFRSLLLISVHQ